MAMGQKVQEAVKKVDSGCELFRKLPNKVYGRRKMLLGLVVLRMKVGQ